MDLVEAMEHLSLESDNLGVAWKNFRQKFEIYLKATGSIDKPEPVQVQLLLDAIGPEAAKLYHTFNLTEEEKNNLVRVLDEYEKYCTKTAYEKFDVFVDEVKGIFNIFLDKDKDRDRLVFGILDWELKKRQSLYEKAVKLEDAAEKNESVSDGPSVDQPEPDASQPLNQTQSTVCANCNLEHTSNVKCPAEGKICSFCKRVNHTFDVCPKKREFDAQLLADLNYRSLRASVQNSK